MALKTKRIEINGQTFTLRELPGDVAHDNLGRIITHIAAALSQIPGMPIAPILAGVDEDGKPANRMDLVVSALKYSGLDLASIAAAIGALFSRMSATEARSLRELLLSSATMIAEDGKPIPLASAMQNALVTGGPLTICMLLAHAVELSILPFGALGVSGLATPIPAEPSKESTT